MTNRIILGINVVLVVAVLALALATLSINRTLQSLSDRIAATEQPGTVDNPQSGLSVPRDSREPVIALTSELADELRQLIRDELRAYAFYAPGPASVVGEPADGRAGDASDETAWQSVLVEQELDFYINRGAISPAEMSALQSEIAKLGPEGRADAMRRLVGAINAGELDGRL